MCVLVGIMVVAQACWTGRIYNYKQDYANQEVIATAYIAYVKARASFPSSLKVLVDGGYLPEEARFYRDTSALLADGNISYKESTYAVFAPEDGKVDALRMIARKLVRDGREQLEFNPVINAMVRDELIRSHCRPN